MKWAYLAKGHRASRVLGVVLLPLLLLSLVLPASELFSAFLLPRRVDAALGRTVAISQYDAHLVYTTDTII